MKQIDKDVLVTEIEQRRSKNAKNKLNLAASFEDNYLLSFFNTLEVKDPYEECIQYDSIKTGIQANAEIYSFNIESKLFDQLTKEQQGLWRKEIEQAYISGGENGVEFARDTRYKENLKVKEVDSNDAFIEKACEFLKSYRQDMPDGYGYIAGVVNDKTIEDFKKYMEE